jgi:hypothetical protein
MQKRLAAFFAFVFLLSKKTKQRQASKANQPEVV